MSGTSAAAKKTALSQTLPHGSVGVGGRAAFEPPHHHGLQIEISNREALLKENESNDNTVGWRAGDGDGDGARTSVRARGLSGAGPERPQASSILQIEETGG